MRRTGLVPQRLPVPFSDAVAEGIDNRMLPAQRLRSAVNAVFDKLGTIKKRKGWTLTSGQSVLSGAPLYTTLTIGSACRVVDANGEPLLFDDRAVFGRSTDPAGFVMKGEHTSLSASRYGIVRDQNQLAEDCDSILSSSGEWLVSVYVKRDSTGERDLYYSAMSTVTGQYFVKDRLAVGHIAGAGPMMPRLVLLGSTMICVYRNSTAGTLEGIRITDTGLQNGWLASISLTPVVANPFDVVAVTAAAEIQVGYFTGGNVTLRRFNSSLVNQGAITIAEAGIHAFALDYDGVNIHLAYMESSVGRVRYEKYSSALAGLAGLTVQATTTQFDATGGGQQCARVAIKAAASGTNRAIVLWQESFQSTAAQAFNKPQSTVLRWRGVDTTSGAPANLGSTFHTIAWKLITTRPWRFGAETAFYFMVGSTGWEQGLPAWMPAGGLILTSGKRFANPLLTLRVDFDMLNVDSAIARVVSVAGVGEGVGLWSSNLWLRTGMAVRQVSVDTFTSAIAWTSQAFTFPDTFDYGTSGFSFDALKLDKKDINRFRAAPYGRALVLSGGVPSIHDGYSTFEPSALEAPLIIELTQGAVGSGKLAPGTYAFKVVREWQDALGNTHYSEESLPRTITTTNANAKVTAVIRPPQLTNQPYWFPSGATTAKLCVYRTILDAGKDATYYLDASTMIPPTLPATVDYASISCADVFTDAEIQERVRIYTVGGEVTNTVLPSATVICSTGPRILAVSDERPERIYYSKPMRGGRPAEWNANEAFFDLPVRCTGVGNLDGRGVLFYAKGIYIVEGQGPGVSGLPDDAFALREIGGGVGCSQAASVIGCPTGIIFKNERGFQQLDRGGAIRYIGADIEDTAATYDRVWDAALMPEDNSVHFLVGPSSDAAGGRAILVYNYVRERWSVHKPFLAAEEAAVLTCLCRSKDRSQSTAPYELFAGFGQSLYVRSGYIDGSLPYALIVETADFDMGDIEGYKRLWYLNLLLHRRSSGGLRVYVATDRTDTYTLYAFWTSGNLGTIGDPLHLQTHLPDYAQLGSSFRFKLEEDPQAAGTQGYELNGLELEWGMKRGLNKLADAARK